MSWLVWTLLTLGPIGVLVIAVVALGFGPAVLTLLANSRIARGAGIFLVMGWFLVLQAARIRKGGRDAAIEEVQRANAAAREDRDRIARDVSQLDEKALNRELQRWAPR